MVSESLAAAAFTVLFYHNRVLAAPAVVPIRPALRISPKTELWRGSQRVRPRVYDFRLLRRQTMQKGTVKWFNPTKGYGFIRPSTGDKDVFVHISAVERAGLSTLNEGQTVEYELVTNRGKTSAENLKVS
jgi:CspA family cold shock protein